VLLPKDPDRSARRFERRTNGTCSVEVAVIITEHVRSVWRVGVTDVGSARPALKPVLDLSAARTTPPAGSRSHRGRDRRRDRQRAIWCVGQGRSDTLPRILRGLDDADFGDVRSKKTLSVAERRPLFADYTPPRRTSPTVLRPGATCTFAAHDARRAQLGVGPITARVR